MSVDTVKKAPLTWGTNAYSTATAPSTSTTNHLPGPRADYTLQITVTATGTSGVGGAVVLQGSNDEVSWVAISSATATATQAGTSSTVAGAGIAVSGSKFARLRAATVALTGTGKATITMGM